MKSRATPVGRRAPARQMSGLDTASDDPISLLIGLHVRQCSTMRSRSIGGQLVELKPDSARSSICTDEHTTVSCIQGRG